jgi:hypothetical protein
VRRAALGRGSLEGMLEARRTVRAEGGDRCVSVLFPCHAVKHCWNRPGRLRPLLILSLFSQWDFDATLAQAVDKVKSDYEYKLTMLQNRVDALERENDDAAQAVRGHREEQEGKKMVERELSEIREVRRVLFFHLFAPY